MASNATPSVTPPIAANDAQLRDWLALERTRMANERTLLAYARTAIMLVATGATILKLFVLTSGTIVTGWLLIAFGAGCALVGWRQFHRTRRRLASESPSEPGS